MTINVVPVIMAGGSGTRLWPLSRALRPKQFLTLSGKGTLFQQAALRLDKLADPDIAVAGPCVVGNEEHRFMVLDQLREIGLPPSSVLLEPIGRNTAPALTLAALSAAERGDDPVLVVTPADQTVVHGAPFTEALRAAIRAASDGAIVILGIKPDGPETGYGYIRTDATDTGLPKVERFVEKPNKETAERYLAEGGYYWNAGMFVLKASVWLAALKEFRPDITEAVAASWKHKATDASFIRPGKKEFAAVPSESVDYAVMEKCPGTAFDIRMLALDAGWSDLGAWEAVWQVADKDADGNASVGDTMMHDSRDTLVHATSRLVSVIGLDNIVVVETPDAVMVADRSRSQEVKQIVNRLEAGKRTEHTLHRQVHRPWGWYDSIDQGPRFQVKRIMVKPGGVLSLQMHHQSRRALDRRVGHRRSHLRRQEDVAHREPEHLHPAGPDAPARQPGHHSARDHRSPVGKLSRRGRHRALRRHLRAQLTRHGNGETREREDLRDQGTRPRSWTRPRPPGIALDHSCRTGRCGTCKAEVVSGTTRAIRSEESLSAGDAVAGFILTCARTAESDLELDIEDLGALANIKVKTLPCRLNSIDKLAPDVLELTLRLPPNNGFSALPGQYIDVIGKGGVRRSYSIANAFAPASGGMIELHVRQVEGGELSRYWFEEAKANDLLRFEGPRGTFFMRESSGRDIVFLATGTGIAPVKAMLEGLAGSMAQAGTDARPKSITVFWGGRVEADLYWVPDVVVPNLEIAFYRVLSRAGDNWVGLKGHVQDRFLDSEPDLANTTVYACGSMAMIESARTLLTASGLSPKKFYSDAFVSSSA